MTIADPIEILESQIESQIDLVYSDMTYPCYNCGRRFDIDAMRPISAHPASPLECGRDDCND